MKMSKIEFEQLSDDVVEVIIPPETPMAMVQALTKSFAAKGLVEDLSKSTLSVRYFFKPQDAINDKADQLIKSLSGLVKNDDQPYWHPKAQMANQKRVREMDRGYGTKPAAPAAPSTPGKMFDNTPAAQNTAGGSGKRYAFISDKVNKEEGHDEDCDCAKCQEVAKSNYGPKGTGQYSAVDNARRKANNTGDATGIGPNVNAKAYSSKPGQMSAKQQASVSAQIQARANKKQPVKVLSPEEIEAQYGKQPIKKSDEWAQHNSIPSAEEEIMKFAKSNKTQSGEEVSANQLMNLMQNKNMLGEKIHPAIKDMFAAPPPQPTDQQMFGHLAVTEEMEKANNEKWQKGAFGWLAEAAQPISQRFASEEEEMAYWARIKVGNTGSDEGY